MGNVLVCLGVWGGGRVMVYYAIVLGVVALVGAKLGTKLLHWIRVSGVLWPSSMVFLVSAAVGISCYFTV